MHKSSKRYGIAIYVVLLVSIILLGFMTDQLMVRIVAVIAFLLALGCGGVFYTLMKRSMLAQAKQTENILYVLQRKRHDWMNGIQIIYGYSKLKKHERVLENIETLSEHLKQESNLSKIEDPQLEWFFHEFSARTLKFEFELELHEQMNLSKMEINRPLLHTAVSQTAETIERAAAYSEQEEPHYLTVNMDILNEHVRVTFHYDGKYDEQTVRSGLEHIRPKSGKGKQALQLNNDCAEDHFFIELKLPYRVRINDQIDS